MNYNADELKELRDIIASDTDPEWADVECCFQRDNTATYPAIVDLIMITYGGSMDAALKVISQLLPKWVFSSMMMWGDHCRVELLETYEKDGGRWHGSASKKVQEEGTEISRTLLLAILSALIAQEGE